MDYPAHLVLPDEWHFIFCKSVDEPWFFNSIDQSMAEHMDGFMGDCLSAGFDFLAFGEAIDQPDCGNAPSLIFE